ncbi:glucuronate isomerase [Paenarthrobacter ureafaciens]|uniref:Uronate isomerase n=1 Tax=Paenarthrobacter ureafaciens TaxID=37931 RepID=A0AAX3EJU0_PAEUR|nr:MULTISPECIES: glucuronate isomerase [Paenarthrobacter]NKR11924.1 glucuronate isomerase [Arthrobacter sp. M5]NKR15512.1 glucuronate isomerase [Arthrobacter sp. M6]OEH58506.1 glucuronate isomerase [Arthrobacter sp. D4]OEH64793.1 glucuronate isomerase [Arthrobacter sp. D2]MDO5863159.1 glucuronate isomerase [Paenarthrobacter sp. SD-2]
MSTSIATHPDRLLPADPGTREIARNLLARVQDLPIISPHGHVDATVIEQNTPFPDPAALLVTPDHYVTRLIHASGVSMEQLQPQNAGAREIWRTFCRSWPLFEGTASGYWLRTQFQSVFGLHEELSAETADASFDAISARLAEPGFRPRELFKDFNIEVLATTDDPLDDLSSHKELAHDPSFHGRVLPTFRPDAYINIAHPSWGTNVERLIAAAGDGATGYGGYIAALENRRRYFVEHGAVSADHGVRTPATLKLDPADAEALFERARSGKASFEDREVFEAHMTYQMARMSVEDGLVMTIHPGSFRNHHTPTFEAFGADTGHDIPFAVNYTEGIRPLLQDFGTAKDFHLVLFTLDETVFSRELAPLAGFYPSVYLGAPWWFLDAPDAMLRFRSAVTETAGFSRSSGFIDDTRAFCSIPARHGASRRVEASFLARLVAEHRISEDRAHEVIVDVVDSAPRRVFKL